MKFSISNGELVGGKIAVSPTELKNEEIEDAVARLVEEANFRKLKLACLEPPKPPPAPLDEIEKALVETGRKILAIRHLRDRSGCLPRDAKEAVDAYAAKPEQVLHQLSYDSWWSLDSNGVPIAKPRSVNEVWPVKLPPTNYR